MVLQQPRQQQAVCSKPDLAWTVQSPETLRDVRQLLTYLQQAAATAAAAAAIAFMTSVA